MPELSLGSPEYISQLARCADFFGDAGLARLQRGAVTVVGLGGVGSHAACALARTGVGRLRIIDFDEVTPSSLNRCAVATPRDVGRPKVEVMAEHLHAIRRELVVESHIAFLHQDTAPELLAGPPDFVIDAIDAEAPKVALLYYCATHGIPVVACMGAAARHDASQIRVADLSETSNCPLARNVRGKLKKLGVTRGITAIYSLERPRPSLPPDDNEPRLHKGRIRRRLPSLITIPGIFGFVAAGLVLDHLAGVASPPARQQDP